MRNDGTHLESVYETAGNRIHRFFLKIKGALYTWWNKKKFKSVGQGFQAPGPIHVVNGRNITLGNNVFLGLHCQLYACPDGEIIIGDNCSIDRFVEIRGGRKIEIGNDVRIVKDSTLKAPPTAYMTIGSRTLISQGCIFDGDVRIGEDVIFGPCVFLNGAYHGFDRRDIPMNQQTGKSGTIVIEDDVWIGYNAALLVGVHIPKGSIVGANAVVNRSVEPYSINVGVPAVTKKYRN